MSITSAVINRTALTERDGAEMFELFETMYENVSRPRFHADLAEKDWVVLLRENDRIAGFSTARRIDVAGTKALFSGDTIVAREHWDSLELPRAWGRFVIGMAPVWWFLISKGVRTYLYLPLYFNEFWPRHDAPTPPDAQRRLDSFARSKYPDDYRDGLISFREPHGNLRPEFAAIPAHRESDPHARFFIERNPDYRRGTELACLAEISEANLRPAARRVLGLRRLSTP